MSLDTINFLVQAKRSFLQFYNSDFFFGLKIFLAIYVTVLLVDIILIVILNTPGMYLRVIKGGANVPIGDKKKMQKRWEKVKTRLQGGNEGQYKAAVLEADEMVNEVLSKIGYQGENMGEILDNISRDQLENIEELREAHEIRNEIIRKGDFILSKTKTDELLSSYQKALETVDFL